MSVTTDWGSLVSADWARRSASRRGSAGFHSKQVLTKRPFDRGQMSERSVPADWLAATVNLLNEMAGEGICIEGCADPADLMCQIADHLGVGTNDDAWNDAVRIALELADA